MLIPIFGRFGHLLHEIAERCGAEVFVLEKLWGSVFEPEEVIAAMETFKPHVVVMVHGETSTGRVQPLADIGRSCRRMDALFIVDTVATHWGHSCRDRCLDAGCCRWRYTEVPVRPFRNGTYNL